MTENPTGRQAEHPIGVFDSGVGGLTVVRALMERLPCESIVYFGDTARVPYGVKSVETINQFTRQIVEFLLDQQVKLLVIACNTMAAVASQMVRDLAPIGVLDVIGAGATAAVGHSRSRVVGVIGTPTTINSGAYPRALHLLDPSIRCHGQACPLIVPLVEEGWLEHPVTEMVAREYLAPMLARQIDTLVLGCTHYPLIKPVLQRVVGPSVFLVDSAEVVARDVATLLEARGLMNATGRLPTYRYHVTDVPLKFQTIGEQFLGRSLEHVHVERW